MTFSKPDPFAQIALSHCSLCSMSLIVKSEKCRRMSDWPLSHLCQDIEYQSRYVFNSQPQQECLVKIRIVAACMEIFRFDSGV